MSDSDDSESSDIERAANEALLTIVPAKSQRVYEIAYNKFGEWLKSKKAKTVTENVILAYFLKKSTETKPSTMWCEYSKLRTMIHLKNGVDISSFAQLILFLKGQSKGHVAKKSNVFTRMEIERFVREADDNKFLLLKVILIVGVAGACRRLELLNLSVKDIKDLGEIIVVDLTNTKNNKDRQFVISKGNIENINLVEIFRKYQSLRTKTTVHDRFFVGYRTGGKCTSQPVGINFIGAAPKKIAEYLGLQNCGLYTGHCFRRSSATLLADTGAGMTALKRLGGWKSSSVVDGYLEDSVENKRKTAHAILGQSASSSSSVGKATTSARSKIFRPNPVHEGTTNPVEPNTLATTTNSTESSVASSQVSNMFASSQQVTVSSQVSQSVVQSENTQFLHLMNRSLQGTNMYKCTVNFNLYQKK